MSKSAMRKLPCASKLFDFSVVIAGDLSNGGARRDRTDDLMLAKHALSQLSYGPGYRDKALVGAKMVGLGRLELPTSRLSSARSNQLSYKPDEASSSGFAAQWRKTTTEKGRETKAATRRQLSSDEIGKT